MRSIYICDTPYQLVNAINLYLNLKNDEKADLVIVNQFTNAKKYYKNIKKINLYNRVYFIKKEKRMKINNKLVRFFYLSYRLLFPRKTIRKQLANDLDMGIIKTKYDRIYSSVYSFFVSSMLKINRKSDFYLFDDGIGSYFGHIGVKSGGKAYELFSRLFHVGCFAAVPECLYVNNVSICKSQGVKDIQNLPEWTEELISCFYSIFEIDPDYVPSGKIIFLSIPDEHKEFTLAKSQIIKELLKYKENVLVRYHPREEINELYNGFQIEEKKEMWELLINKMEIEKNILIGFGSTALLTPKLLFNKEPYIIDLCQMCKKNNDVFGIIQSVYSNKNICFSPKNYKDLDLILDKIVL